MFPRMVRQTRYANSRVFQEVSGRSTGPRAGLRARLIAFAREAGTGPVVWANSFTPEVAGSTPSANESHQQRTCPPPTRPRACAARLWPKRLRDHRAAIRLNPIQRFACALEEWIEPRGHHDR